jgi:hypothetical protein
VNHGSRFWSIPLACAFALTLAVTLGATSPARAIEKSLFGVALGEKYETARARLEAKYGEPFASRPPPARYDAFAVGPEGSGTLIISNTETMPSFVTAVQLSSKEPIDGLGFVAGIQFGQPAELLELSLPFSTTAPAADGYTLHSDPHQNFSIESFEGKVRSIRIGLEGTITPHSADSLFVFSETQAFQLMEMHKSQESGPITEAQMRELAVDPLLEHCEFRQPIDMINGVPLVRAHIGVPVKGDLRAGNAYFLLDTGWSTMGISRERCERTDGCQVTDSSEGFAPTFAEPTAVAYGGAYLFAVEDFHALGKPAREVLAVATERDVEGVIGGSILLSRPTFLNFKHGYICFPREPMASVAKKLTLESVPAVYDAGRVWVDFQVNGVELKDYFVDSGSTGTSILPEHAKKLGVGASETGGHVTAAGPHEAKVYGGPFAIRFGGANRTVASLDEAPSPEWRKLGMDVIGGLILGLDAESGVLYVGD